MNFRTTLFLLVLVVAVGITIYFTTGKGETGKTPDKTEAHKLITVDSGDVTRLAITNADGSHLVFHKSDGNWKIEQPMTARAKSYEVDSLVRSLVNLQSRAQLDESKKTSGGLDHPSFVVELTGKGDKVTKLSFGDSSPVGDSLYVLVDDNAKPEIVGNSIYKTLNDPASKYRDMKIVTTPSSDIKQVEIAEKGTKITLEKSGETWKMTGPVSAPAESSAVTDLLSSLTNLDATDILDAPPASVTNTLSHPRVAISFSTQAPATQPTTQKSEDASAAGMQTLRFGGYQDITKKSMFVSLNGSDVAVVPATSEKSFEKTALDFRNKDVATIDPELVKTFTVSINRPATTQPTTRPAELREFTIERHKVAPPVLGPALPSGGLTAPTTQPTVATTQPSPPTTQSTILTTRPSATTSAPAVATMQTTQPTVATTQPTTQAVVATTQPADEIADAKWIFASGGTGRAEEGQVEALLNSFHPLHVEKYTEPAKETGNTYTLTIHAVPSKAAESAEDYVFTLIETPTRVIGTYKDLQFEVDRGLIDKLTGDFKTKKIAPPPSPPPSFGGGGRSPFGGGQ